MVFLAVMLIVGTLIFVIAPTKVPEYSYYEIDGGSILFYPDYYNGSPTVTVPASVDGQSVEHIGADCFSDCDRIQEVILPNSVTSIQDKAFFDCSGLVCIKLPEGLKTIGPEAFADCTALEAIYVPASVTEIAPDAFRNCPKLHTIFFTGSQAQWERLYPQTISENTKIYTVSGPEAHSYQPN